jgi:hypothetical protein
VVCAADFCHEGQDCGKLVARRPWVARLSSPTGEVGSATDGFGVLDAEDAF